VDLQNRLLRSPDFDVVGTQLLLAVDTHLTETIQGLIAGHNFITARELQSLHDGIQIDLQKRANAISEHQEAIRVTSRLRRLTLAAQYL
jgi:hypothetical protein